MRADHHVAQRAKALAVETESGATEVVAKSEAETEIGATLVFPVAGGWLDSTGFAFTGLWGALPGGLVPPIQLTRLAGGIARRFYHGTNFALGWPPPPPGGQHFWSASSTLTALGTPHGTG
jgi:hypothetical protein